LCVCCVCVCVCVCVRVCFCVRSVEKAAIWYSSCSKASSWHQISHHSSKSSTNSSSKTQQRAIQHRHYVYIYLHVYIYMRIRIHIFICIHVYANACTYTYKHAFKHRVVTSDTTSSWCKHIYMYIHIYVNTCIHTCICMHANITLKSQIQRWHDVNTNTHVYQYPKILIHILTCMQTFKHRATISNPVLSWCIHMCTCISIYKILLHIFTCMHTFKHTIRNVDQHHYHACTYIHVIIHIYMS